MTTTTQQKRRIHLFDTTLRDGAQTPAVNFRSDDKMRILRALVDLGVDYVEVGWPGANPTDTKVFADWADERTAMPEKPKTQTVSFGMVRDPRKSVGNDASLQTVLGVSADTYCLFGKSWDFQAHLLGATDEEYLRAISESVKAAAKKGEAIFDAEHFFQGYRANPTYALNAVKAAYEAGARWVVLCDTNGIMEPDDISEIVREVTKHVPGSHLGIHTHNDHGFADANTLAAVKAGCCHVQGTINGLGERCGNANLINFIGSLFTKDHLRAAFDCGLEQEDLLKLKPLAELVAEISGIPLPANAPFVGECCADQKAGKHVDLVLKDERSYTAHDSRMFGIEPRIEVSNQSGISNFLPFLNGMGLDTGKENPSVRALVSALKHRTEEGYVYKNGMGSFEVLALRTYGLMPKYFDLSSYRAVVERLPGNGTPSASEHFKLAAQATVEFLDCEGKMAEPDVSNGNGPVNALDGAMRRSLLRAYPELAQLKLLDFRQTVLNPKDGTDAIMQVQIVSYSPQYGEIKTIGVSGNSADASVVALLDSYALHLKRLGVAPRAFGRACKPTGTQPH
ncbi:MAG: citramalate synthase [Alphaproteobacteria bacterium]|nr:citramalate synthase [Alphaproteobacteria bacterium]